MKIRHIKLPVLKPILVFTTQGQKCIVSEVELFTFDNFQSSHPVEINKVFANSTLVEQHQLDIPREQTCVEYLITIGYKLLMG